MAKEMHDEEMMVKQFLILAVAHDFQQCGILIIVYSEEPVQSPI